MVEGESWPASWLRGFLELAVLAVLAEGESYGYAIARRLDQHGFGRLKGGTLYPVLARLEERQAVQPRWGEGSGGPGRKFYVLTDLGRQRLDRESAQWQDFVAAADQLLGVRQ